MTTYLVMKRMKEDRVFMPGEVLVDPVRAERLVERGYLAIVPDDYAEKRAAAEAAGSRPSIQSLLDRGYSEKAAKSIASGKDPMPKYVQEETERIEAREALREERGADELERLAALLGTTAEAVLDLSDEEYEEVLAENPAPAESTEPEPVPAIDDQPKPRTPRQTLTEMADDELAVLANQNQVLPPEGITGENRKEIISAILEALDDGNEDEAASTANGTQA